MESLRNIFEKTSPQELYRKFGIYSMMSDKEDSDLYTLTKVLNLQEETGKTEDFNLDVLIECNATYGNVLYFQLCNKDRSETIGAWVEDIDNYEEGITEVEKTLKVIDSLDSKTKTRVYNVFEKDTFKNLEDY